MRSLGWFAPVLSTIALVACGGGDPGGGAQVDAGNAILDPPGFQNGGDDGGDWPPKKKIDGGASPSPSPTSGVDAAPPTPAPVSDPVDPGTPVDSPQNAFTAAGSYVDELPAFDANSRHASPVTGVACLDCHDGTTAAKFRFAGTVWQAPSLTKGVAGVEVRIIDANSIAYSVHSDHDGNFWSRADDDLAMPALSGVRTSSFKAVGQLNGTSCNQCHNTGVTDPGRLFVQ